MQQETNPHFCAYGRAVVNTELEAIRRLEAKIDDSFAKACEILLNCQGRIVVMGMGKSGHIGRKIAATLSSTGSPAFFIHPGEASHGDIGMIIKTDAILAISNSGVTEEIVTILPIIKRLGLPLITITGRKNSIIAKQADVNLDASIDKEACPLNLAPTASTTTALVLGDALAIALLKAKGFTKEDFAFSHPGGHLGKKLLLRLSDIMFTGDAMPKVQEDTSLREALLEMSAKSLGMTAVVDTNNVVVGVFTDGDLRRILDQHQSIDVNKTLIRDVMNTQCTTVKKELLAAEALQMMETKRFNGLLVVDDENKLVGELNIHNLLRAGVL